MNPNRIKKILDFIKEAKVLTIDDSPVLMVDNIFLNEVRNEKLNEVLDFYWVNENDIEDWCSRVITEENLDQAEVRDNKIFCDCTDGTGVEIALFDLQPHVLKI